MPALRRSCLFMPAANERALRKATAIPCDAVLFDLEDAVAPDNKVAARGTLAARLAELDFGGRELTLRINASTSRWWDDDLDFAIGLGIDNVLLPKVEDPALVHAVGERLAGAGRADLGIWVMIETPRGVANVDRIAAAHARLDALVMGTNDLGAGMRIPHSPGREGFLYALSRCVVAARAHGLDAIDGVFNGIADAEGLRAECVQGRQLGFDGKTLIHPGQVEIANDVFSPDDAEVEAARALLAHWRREAAAGAGVVAYQGRMIEQLHVDEAERLLAFAERLKRG